MDDVGMLSVGRRTRFRGDAWPGEERAIVLVVSTVQFGGSPPMPKFATGGVAKQTVALGNHLLSPLLRTDRLSGIPLQCFNPVGQAEHQRRRHYLICQTDVSQADEDVTRLPPLS